MVRLTMLASVLGTTITPYISIPNPQLSGGPPPRLRIQLLLLLLDTPTDPASVPVNIIQFHGMNGYYW